MPFTFTFTKYYLIRQKHYDKVVEYAREDEMKKSKWKKFRPDSNEALEAALLDERKLTARWYQRISGTVAWEPGERERLYALMESQADIVDRLNQKNAADQFAALPESAVSRIV